MKTEFKQQKAKINKKKKKGRKIKLKHYYILILFSLGAIPLTVYCKYMYGGVSSNEVEFFSFLAQCISNILTFLGILLAMISFEQERLDYKREKQDIKEKEQPFIIPQSKYFKGIDMVGDCILCDINTVVKDNDVSRKYMLSISHLSFNIVNIGKEHALDVEVFAFSDWDLYRNWFDNEKDFYKIFLMKELEYKSYFVHKTTVPVITCSSLDSPYEITLPESFENIIYDIIENIPEGFSGSNLVLRDLPIGKLAFKYKSIYSNYHPIIYTCKLTITLIDAVTCVGHLDFCTEI